MGTGALFPGAKRQMREADHSPPSSAEVKNGRAIFPLPHMSSCLIIKPRNSFTLVNKKQDVLGRTNRLLSSVRHGPHWKRHVQQFFYCCACIRHRGNVSTEPLPSNDRGIFTEPLPSNDEGIFIEPLPSKDRGIHCLQPSELLVNDILNSAKKVNISWLLQLEK
jgi:hypothetical protein